MMLIIYYLLIHAKVLHVSLLWSCQLSKLQADVQHKYKLSGRLSSAIESLYHALLTLFMLTLQSATEISLVYFGARRKEDFGWSCCVCSARVSLSIAFWEPSKDVITNWLS